MQPDPAESDRATERSVSAALWVARCVAAFVMFLAATACAQPVAALWPPAPGDATHRIVVSTDAWHSVIGLRTPDAPTRDEVTSRGSVTELGDATAHGDAAASDGGATRAVFEEWGYAEKGYYLEGSNGVCGTLRALFVPSAAVVVVTRGDRTWAERTPQPPARSWEFDLTDAGLARLIEFLHADVAAPAPISHAGGSDWFDAKSSYHAFHHCHHWTAAALRAAGLPVRPAFALFKWSLESQLDRAARIAAEGGGGGNR